MSRKGFSLIELLIVSALTVVLGTATFYLVSNRQGTSELQASATQAVSALRTAQQNALSAASSTAWGVRFDNTTSTAPRFVMFASSSYSLAAETMQYPMSSRLSFDPGTIPPGTVKDVVFGLRNGTTASTSIMMRVTGRDKAYLININATGLVTATLVTATVSTSTAPTASAINPTTGSNTAPLAITSITGTNFVSGATVRLTRAGQSDIVGTGFSFSGPTSLTGGAFDLTGVQSGTWNVVVTNPDLQSATCNACLTVTFPDSAPTVTDVTPDSSDQGVTVTTTITGTGFISGASVAFSGTGIAVNSTVFNNATQLTANITIAPGATVSARNVTVTNPDTQTGVCSACFTVGAAPPTVVSSNPSSRGAGVTGSVLTLTGTQFVTGATPTFSGTGITVTTSTVNSDTSMSVTISVATSATVSARNVTVTNPDLQAGVCVGCFSVNTAPTVASTTPASAAQGSSTIIVQVNGANFVSGATGVFSGAGITIHSTTFLSSTALRLNLSIASSSPATARDITVTNPDGGSVIGTNIFTVVAP